MERENVIFSAVNFGIKKSRVAESISRDKHFGNPDPRNVYPVF